MDELNTHHRKPRSIGGKSDKRNLSCVLVTQHRAWHTLFANCEPDVIARIITETWLDPDYEMVARKKS